MGYIPKRIYESAEIPEAIVKQTKYIKPILKKTTKSFPNKEKKNKNMLLYMLIFMLFFISWSNF